MYNQILDEKFYYIAIFSGGKFCYRKIRVNFPGENLLGGKSYSLTVSLCSISPGWYTDVAGNASPMPALTIRIGLGVAPLWSREALRTR